MTFLYAPYSSGSPAGATVTDAEWGELGKALLGTGVIKGALIGGSPGGDMAISAPGGVMQVNLGTGQAMVYGHWCQNDASAAQTIAAADPTNPRIDRVVLKHDISAKTVSVVVKTGTPAGSPVAPSLTQTPSTWELSLAQVRVNAGVTAITTGNITDERTYAVATIPYTFGNASGNVPLSNGTNNTNLNADMVDGFHAGHATGQVAVADGTVVSTLNADKHDGFDAGNASGNIPVSNGTLNTNLNADMADGFHVGHASGQIPVSDGTVNTNLNADLLDGISASGFAQPGSHNTVTPIKISAGTVLPGSLDANEIFFLLA